MIDFDPAKDAANIAKHGISLARAAEMRIVVTIPDLRRDYGEDRYLAFGEIDGLMYCLAFADRNRGVRAISLRRSRWKEYRHYVP
jgi:uncharacterized DUF497 family protein